MKTFTKEQIETLQRAHSRYRFLEDRREATLKERNEAYENMRAIEKSMGIDCLQAEALTWALIKDWWEGKENDLYQI